MASGSTATMPENGFQSIPSDPRSELSQSIPPQILEQTSMPGCISGQLTTSQQHHLQPSAVASQSLKASTEDELADASPDVEKLRAALDCVEEGPQPDQVTLMKEEAVSQVLGGAPYRDDMWGPPRPASQNERMETLVKVKKTLVGKPTDPDIDNILKLALKVFGFESAVVSLVADKSFKIQAAEGPLAGLVGIELSWLVGICGYTLEPSHHEVLVVEDMTKDPRFCKGSVKGFTGFYCGAPLVAANGHRLGTLCLGHSKPGTITAQQVNILCNMTEMVVRHLEKVWVETVRQTSISMLTRSLAAYLRPLLVLKVAASTAIGSTSASRTTSPGQIDGGEGSAHGGNGGNWTIEFSNEQAKQLLGLSDAKGSLPFWESVESGMRSQSPWAPFTAALQSSACFSATFRLMADKQRQQDRLWLFEFRPAGREALDAEAQLIGIPSWLPDGREIRQEAFLFFVEIAPAESQLSSGGSSRWPSTGPRLCSALTPTNIPRCFAGLELGPLLGKGSYGRVYRGYYNHMPVAVKVIDTDKVRRNEAGEPLEAIMTGNNKHPFILQTIGWTVTSELDIPLTPGSGGNEGSQTWLLLEYCDKSCLQDAMSRGIFREGGGRLVDPPNMSAICWTVHEISRAMAALHSNGVVHSDLKAGNVLLKTAENTRGFVAKVADFGMARQMGIEERIRTNQYGTVTHCSPELLLESTVSKASDIWAFGVIMWELFYGVRAWAGLTHPQVMHAVGVARTPLTFDSARPLALPAHDTYFQLAEACMAPEPSQRPSFEDIQMVLKSAAEAWDKLKTGPNNGAAPTSLQDTSSTQCLS